jgi:hypothetical protein
MLKKELSNIKPPSGLEDLTDSYSSKIEDVTAGQSSSQCCAGQVPLPNNVAQVAADDSKSNSNQKSEELGTGTNPGPFQASNKTQKEGGEKASESDEKMSVDV